MSSKFKHVKRLESMDQTIYDKTAALKMNINELQEENMLLKSKMNQTLVNFIFRMKTKN